MNVVDITTLTQVTDLQEHTNFLVWDEDTQSVARTFMQDLSYEISQENNLDVIGAKVVQSEEDIVTINESLDSLSNEVTRLSGEINNITNTTGTLTFTGEVEAAYDGTSDVSIHLSHVLNRTWYVDDGLSDDEEEDCTQHIQVLINTAYSLGGGTLVFGARTYHVNSLILHPKVRLIGVGIGLTIIKKNVGVTTHNSCIFIPATSLLNEIKDMTICGSVGLDEDYTDPNDLNFFLSNDEEEADGILFEGIISGISESLGSYQTMYDSGVISETNRKNNRYITISNVAVIGFGRDGIHIDKQFSYDITIENCYAFANRESGFYIYANNSKFKNLHSEKNGCSGFFIISKNSKFDNLYSAKNGYIDVSGVYTSTESSDIFGSTIMGNVYKNWGIIANTTRCDFTNISIENNYSGGIIIISDDSSFKLAVDQNGYGNLGNNGTEQLGLYDLIKIIRANHCFIELNITTYNGTLNGNHAVSIDDMEETIINYLIRENSAANVEIIENDSTKIIDCLINGMII